MTDKEIVKALECCNEWKNPEDCTSCPAKGKGECCVLTLRIEALNLINRQKAENSNLTSDLTSLQNDLTSAKTEIERLNAEINRLLDTRVTAHSVEKQLKTAKSEAYREFAEEYKDQIKNYTGMFTDDSFMVNLEAVLSAVDFIKNKLVGDNGRSRPSVPTSEKGVTDK